MTRTQVRRAGARDADVVLAMVRELAGHQGEGPLVTSSAADWRRLLGRDDVVVLVAQRDGRVAGYVSALRRVHLWSAAEIVVVDDLYVRPSSLGGEVSRELMLALARYAAPERLPVTWQVHPDNESAQRFYATLGALQRDTVVVSRDAAMMEP